MSTKVTDVNYCVSPRCQALQKDFPIDAARVPHLSSIKALSDLVRDGKGFKTRMPDPRINRHLSLTYYGTKHDGSGRTTRGGARSLDRPSANQLPWSFLDILESRHIRFFQVSAARARLLCIDPSLHGARWTNHKDSSSLGIDSVPLR